MNEKKEQNILKVLETLGGLIAEKDREIDWKQLRISTLEEQIEKAEKELNMTREALNQACVENDELTAEVERLSKAYADVWDDSVKPTKGA